MVNLYKPTLRRQDMQGVLEAMADEAIGPGERKSGFEEAFKELVPFKKAYALRSLEYAIRFSLQNLNLGENARVLISPLAPSIYKRVLDSLGIEIAFADVDPLTGILKWTKGAEKCDAIIQYLPSENPIPEEYKQFREKTILDISAVVGQKGLEEWGAFAVCSLEDNDVISCGGGAILLSDNEITSSMYKEISMPDLNASLGNVQLKFFRDYCKKRREIVGLYNQAFLRVGDKHKLFGVPFVEIKEEDNNAFRFSITLNSKLDDMQKFAKKSGVAIGRTFEDSLAITLSLRDDSLSDSIYTASRTIYFPLYYFLKTSEIETVSKMIAHLI